MDAAANQFGADARTLLRVAAAVRRFTPAAARPWAARCIGQRFSPYIPQRARVVASMQKALGLSVREADAAWREWLASQGLFALTVFDYGRLSPHWLQRAVTINDPALLQEVVRGGGLVLSWHSGHHNTLGCVLGLSGGHSSMLAASARSSPYYAQIGGDIERINAASATHFGGGSYLYTDNPVLALAQTSRLLAHGKGRIVISLHDLPGAVSHGAPASGKLLGKILSPQTGVIELVLNARVPLYAGALFAHKGGLRLQLQRLDGTQNTAAVLQEYLDILAATAKAFPACWQGWDWYDTLPDVAPIKPAATAHSDEP